MTIVEHVRNAEPIVEPTLAELAATANREHALAVQAVTAARDHAIKAGEALIAARDHVPDGWVRWIEENFHGGVSTAHQLMRFARYHHLVPTEVGWSRAQNMLRGLPGSGNRPYWQHDPAIRQRTVELVRNGATLKSAAEECGVAVSTVSLWVRGIDKRREREQAAREALRRQRIAEAALRVGGSVAESYSAIRRTAQIIDRASRETDKPEVRVALGIAYAEIVKAEDEIVRALGVA